MNRIVALCLLAIGCAGSVRPLSAGCPDNYSDIRDMAYEVWKDVGVETPNCYSLEFLPKNELTESCGRIRSDGCSYNVSQRIYIDYLLSVERQMIVLYHEVGHLVAVNEGHLTCSVKPGDDIMCPAGASLGTVPTLRDAAFVKGLLLQ